MDLLFGSAQGSGKVPGPPKEPKINGPISPNTESRQYRFRCFGHFEGS